MITCSVYGRCNLGFIRNTAVLRVPPFVWSSRTRCRIIPVSFGPMAAAMSHVSHIVMVLRLTAMPY